MSQDNISLSDIMRLKKEVESTYCLLTKTYQAELLFIQKKIEKDNYIQNRIESCCWALPFSSSGDAKDKNFAYKNYSKYNPRFYALFKKMTPQQRKEYFFEMLNLIKHMCSLYQKYVDQQEYKHDKNGNRFRCKIIKKLIRQEVNKQLLEELSQKQGGCLFEAIVEEDSKSSRQVCRMQLYKLVLMNQMGQRMVDIRNYLMIQQQAQKYTNSILMQAIYQGVKPTKLKLNFINSGDVQKCIAAFRQIVKIGKIQKLVTNLVVEKIKGKDQRSSIQNNDLLKQTFMVSHEELSDEQQQLRQEPDTLNGSEIACQQKRVHRTQVRLKKKITIKIQKYQEIKKKLILTLQYLTEKRQMKNSKINQFIHRPVIHHSRRCSKAIEQLLSRNQNCFVHPPQPDQSARPDFFQGQQKVNCLQIINYKNGGNQHIVRKLTDSFIHNDDDVQFQQRRVLQVKKIKSFRVEYCKFLFAKMFPDYSFPNMFNIIGMERRVISQEIYNLPQKAIKGEQRSTKDQKDTKFRQMWLQKFNLNCRFFQRRDNPNIMKISFSLKVQVKALVEALINIQAYTFWHPNCQKITILSSLTDDNVINYEIECISQSGYKYLYRFFMHVFKFENKYYIFERNVDLMQDHQNQAQNLTDYFRWIKGKAKKHKFKFMLLRASASQKNGFTDILIEAHREESDNKTSQKERRQDISFLLNFNLIPKYWQLQQCTSLFYHRLNAEWVVSKELSTNESEDLDFGNVRDQLPLEKLSSQVSIDLQDLQEQVSAQNYFDV